MRAACGSRTTDQATEEFEVKPTMYLQELLNAGGVIMVLILVSSLVGLFVVIERLLHFRRARINVPDFLHGLFNVLKRGNVVEAVDICDKTPGPVAHVVRAAIVRCGEDEATLRQVVAEASLAEVPRLERNLRLLGTIAHLAPLLGLLGTVLGMIGLFQTMENAGPLVATADLAHHVWRALVTTAAGLVVSIPAHAFYNLLVVRVETLALDIDKAAAEVIHFLQATPVRLVTPPLPEAKPGEDNGDDE